MPGQGAIPEDAFWPLMTLSPRGHPDEFLFAFSTLATSWAVYRHRPGAKEIELLKPSEVAIDAVITDHWATSADGTQVPYHTMRLTSAASSERRPALMYAYGGFHVPW